MTLNLLEILCECASPQSLQNNAFTFTADKFTKKLKAKNTKEPLQKIKKKILTIFLWLK